MLLYAAVFLLLCGAAVLLWGIKNAKYRRGAFIAGAVLGLGVLVCLIWYGASSPEGTSSGEVPSFGSSSSCQVSSPAESPAPLPPQPKPEPVLKEINPYTFRTDERYYLKKTDRPYVKDVIDGVRSRKKTILLSEDYDANLRVLGAVMESPYWFFVKEDRFSEDHTKILLDYAYSAEKQKEMQDFMDESFLHIINDNITPEMNDTDKLLAIHHYFGSHIDYNYEWLHGLNMSDEKYLYPDIAVYEALKTGKGVCHTYSYLCEFALRQLGIECLRFTGEIDGDEDRGHMWNLVKLDGKYYHEDITWDANNNNDQVGLEHFCMTDDERREDGFDLHLYEFDSSYHGLSCTDDKFKVLRDVVDFRYQGNHIWQLITDSGTALYDTSTGKRTPQ